LPSRSREMSSGAYIDILPPVPVGE
jgi:hypothetical protein